MLFRGRSHVLFNDYDLIARIKNPATLKVLKQLQHYYEVRTRRVSFEESGAELSGITVQERHELSKLLSLCSVWMRQPIRVDFGEINEKNQSKSNATGDGSSSSEEVKLLKAASRRARRARRKSAKLGI